VKAVLSIARGMYLELFRRKDFYVMLICMLALLSILASQRYFNVEGITRYLRDFGYTVVMLFSFLIAVIVSASQIPWEIESGTIYPLIAKPVSRLTIVTAKFFGSFMTGGAAFVAYYAVFVLFCAAQGEGFSVVLFAQAFYLGILFIAMVSAISLFFSVFMTMSAAVTIMMLVYFFVVNFGDALRKYVLGSEGIQFIFGCGIYYLLPHFDFFDMRIRLTHEWGVLPVWILVAITAYTGVYIALLIFCSSALLEKREL